MAAEMPKEDNPAVTAVAAQSIWKLTYKTKPGYIGADPWNSCKY